MAKAAVTIWDRLYGPLSFTSDELKLFQTKEMARLRQVSLSAVPTWTLPTGICASKFEHSVGVAHLAKIVGAKKEFTTVAKELFFAALAHDMGTPPFSHISEHFQKALLGKNHESFVENVIDGSEFAKVAKRQGINLPKVLQFVMGKKPPMSVLINGTIDLDNLDNSLRWGISMGILRTIPYTPEKLAAAYTVIDNEVGFYEDAEPLIARWEHTRDVVYQFVYSDANLSPAMILLRALYFAAIRKELSPDFFMMTDAEAFSYLATKCNKTTQLLIDRIWRWESYHHVFVVVTDKPSKDIKRLFQDPLFAGSQSDKLAQTLHIPPQDLCIYATRRREFKPVHLPLLSISGTKRFYEPTLRQQWMAGVFISPSINKNKKDIETALRTQITI